MMRPGQLYWHGTTPEACDICKQALKAVFVDAKTRNGPWGMLCPGCHRVHGVGVGTGLGQRYVRQQSDGRWMKTIG